MVTDAEYAKLAPSPRIPRVGAAPSPRTIRSSARGRASYGVFSAIAMANNTPIPPA